MATEKTASETYRETWSEHDTEIAQQVHSMTITYKDPKTNKESVKNTWVDWRLVPTSRPVIAPAQLKKYSQDIPGANGEIDLTTALTGYPAYQNRTGSIEFLVMNTGLDSSLGDQYGYNYESNSTWEAMYAEISNFIHGKYFTVEFEDIKEYYFKGRLTINAWKSDSAYSSITIDYDLEPFKYTVTDSSDLWKWDPFNFRTGVIRTYNTERTTFDTSGETYTIVGTLTPVVPTIFVTVACTLKTDKGTYSLTSGDNKNPLIQVYPGENSWTFTSSSGSGAVAIYFRERSF